MADIRLSRVYDHEPHESRSTFFVERLWPRGVRRDDLVIDGWCKDAAPSTELRQWFGHDPEKWPEFRTRYLAELRRHPEAAASLLAAARAGTLTLVYGAHDTEHNAAVVLRDYLLRRLR